MKERLVSGLTRNLGSRGFDVIECSGFRSCFDVIAKKRDRLILVKILANIEGLKRTVADELKSTARALNALPLIVGEKMKSHMLEDGIIYERYGIIVSNPQTMNMLLENSVPGIYAKRGKYCVSLEKEKLTELRQQHGLTQKMLAKMLDVAPHSVYRYERSGRMSLEVYEKMRELFPEIDLVSQDIRRTLRSEQAKYNRTVTDVKGQVLDEMKHMGFDAFLTNAPFDVFAREKESVFTVVSNDWRRIEHKLERVEEIRNLLGGYSICVSERKVKSDSIVLALSELREFKSAKELYSILRGS